MAKSVKKKVASPKSPSKTSSKTVKIVLLILAIVVLIAIIIIVVLLLQKPKGDDTPELSTCELNKYGCFNTSCPSGYAEVDMGCNKAGKVCCNKIPVNDKSQCEQAGLPCYNVKCPSGYAEVDMFCGAGRACCKKIVVENRTNCELQGFQCFESILPEPTCPDNYVPLDFSCRTGEKCCKQAPQKNKTFFIYGYVKLKEGNCMPPVGSNCTTNPLLTQVAIFGKTLETQMDGSYFRTSAGPIQMSYTNALGYYEIELPYGDYSVFAKDPKENGDYYCNAYGFGDAVCFVSLTNSKQFDVLIDHSTQ